MDRRTLLKSAAAATVGIPMLASAATAEAAAAPSDTTAASYSVAICEQHLNQVQIYPSTATTWDSSTCSWTFSPPSTSSWRLLSDVKFRGSTAFGELALVTASGVYASGGTWGIVQMGTGTTGSLLPVPAFNVANPHAIERIPDSDAIVVVGTGYSENNYAGAGVTVYWPSSSDNPATLAQVQFISYPDAHGVWYDDTTSTPLVWVIGGTRITGYRITPFTSTSVPVLTPAVIRDLGPGLGGGLHSLEADFADSNTLLMTNGSRVFTFDKSSYNLTTLPTPTGLTSTVGVKSFGRDVSGESFWVQTTGTAYDADGNNWSSPVVQFFDATGAPSRSIGPTYSGGATEQPEIYRARLFDKNFH